MPEELWFIAPLPTSARLPFFTPKHTDTNMHHIIQFTPNVINMKQFNKTKPKMYKLNTLEADFPFFATAKLKALIL